MNKAKFAMKSGRLKNFLASALLLMTTLIVCALGAELAVRYVMADRIVLFPRNHAAVQYGDFTLRRMQPNLEFWHQSIDGQWKFKTNNAGFRDDRPYYYEKSEGQLRVIVLGDSHTEGFEVQQDETFSKRLEAELAGQGWNIQVLNTGVSGFSTAEELAFLENEGLKYHPDFVVVAFFANDFEDNMKAGLYSFTDGSLIVKKRDHIPGARLSELTLKIPGLKWLGENSYAYSLLFNFVWDTAKSMLLKGAVTEYAVPTLDVSDTQTNLAAALLLRIAEVCRRNHIRSVLVDIPQIRHNQAREQVISSLPSDFLNKVAPSFDSVVRFSDYVAPTDQSIHVPHGHRHISAKTHAALAQRLAKELKLYIVK